MTWLYTTNVHTQGKQSRAKQSRQKTNLTQRAEITEVTKESQSKSQSKSQNRTQARAKIRGTLEALKEQGAAKYEELLKKFRDRTVAHQLTTAKYQRRQEYLLPLLLLEPLCEKYIDVTQPLFPSTRLSYWIALLSVHEILGLPKPKGAAKLTKHFQTQTFQMDPHRPSCSPELVAQWTASSPTLVIADVIIITYLLGQRLLDVLRLEQRSITEVEQYLAITFFKGKVVKHTGPFSIHVFTTSEVGKILLKARTRMWDQLFVPPTSTADAEKEKVTKIVGDVRKLRRGGLQRLARQGTPIADLLLLSRHKTTQMLMRYLRNGVDALDSAEKTANMANVCAEYFLGEEEESH